MPGVHLRTACLAALELKREDAATHARKFSWRAATEQFLAHLHPRQRRAAARAGTERTIPATEDA